MNKKKIVLWMMLACYFFLVYICVEVHNAVLQDFGYNFLLLLLDAIVGFLALYGIIYTILELKKVSK